MKEIILGEYKRTSHSFRTSEPFAIYFVYAPEGNFVIKGMNNDVLKYVNDNFSKCVYNYTFWAYARERVSYGDRKENEQTGSIE